MVAARLCGQPDFMQGLLQVDDDLTVVGKNQRHHGADPLVINVGKARVIDTVTTGFNGFQQFFSLVQEFRVGHYNFTMLRVCQILVSPIVLAISAVSLSACGQQGALYLPAPAAQKTVTSPPAQFPAPAASQTPQ